MIKNMAFLIILLGLSLLLLFYIAMHWFHNHPEWQDQNVIFARKMLGRGFKVALNGQDWNQNQIPECIAFMPVKKLQKIAPHLQPVSKLIVIEKNSVLFSWSSIDSIAFIPLINSQKNSKIPIIFSKYLDTIETKNTFYLTYSNQFVISQ
jgi:hypothetical protein